MVDCIGNLISVSLAMKVKLFAMGVAVAMSAGFAATAFAQAKPDVLVKQRQSAMTLIGKYWGPMAGMASGKVPFNGQVVVRNAGYLEVLAQMPWDGFDAGTKAEKSRGLPAIWSDAGKFTESQDAFRSAAAALAAASRGGDEGTMKTAIGNVGKTCGGCHDNFRAK
ncbi:MAG: cytochrome c [Betaproteobacteria bacterium]|nr:cytochrome c [Betaproteobacteria bacterium]